MGVNPYESPRQISPPERKRRKVAYLFWGLPLMVVGGTVMKGAFERHLNGALVVGFNAFLIGAVLFCLWMLNYQPQNRIERVIQEE